MKDEWVQTGNMVLVFQEIRLNFEIFLSVLHISKLINPWKWLNIQSFCGPLIIKEGIILRILWSLNELDDKLALLTRVATRGTYYH